MADGEIVKDWLYPGPSSRAPLRGRARADVAERSEAGREAWPNGGPMSDPRDLATRPDLAQLGIAAVQRLAGNVAAASLVRRPADGDPRHPALQRAPDGSDADLYDEPASPTTGTTELTREAGAIIDAAGGALPYHSLFADLDGEATFVVFDDIAVQRLFRHLLAHWGLDAEGMENTAGTESPPPWVGEFRARALNVRPAAEGPDAAEEARLAQLGGRLADSVAAETPSQRIRRQFVEEIQGRIGTTVMTQDQINAERTKAASPGLTPANFTTCIAFFGQVMGQVSAKAGLKAPIVKGPNAYKEINSKAEDSLGSRWKPYTPGARPKPGDLLIFTFNEDEKNPDGSVKYGEGWFAHISILRAIEPMEPGDQGPQERWISVDGGGTTARETFRVFHPDTGLIVGPGSVTRTMKGWIDIEAAVEAGLVPKP